MPRLKTATGALALLAFSLTACTSPAPKTEPAHKTVEVFAAASLGQVGEELIEAYRAEHPNIEISATYAGSAQLVTQIGEGASADILITADVDTMVRAQASIDALAEANPRIIARNELVLATAPGNPQAIGSVKDLASPGTITALCAPQVPCGRLAQQELAQAGITPDKATEEASVSAVAAKIANGQADAGFIYSTDAQALSGREDITVIELPGLEPNSYPVALTQAGQGTAEAQEFANWLVESEQAATVLARYGFKPA